MRGHAPELILSVLKAEFAPVYAKIDKQLSERLPVALTDLDQVGDMLEDFCCLKGVTPEDLKGSLRAHPAMLSLRNEFIGAIILCFQPDRMYVKTLQHRESRLFTCLAKLLEVKRQTVSRTVASCVLYYKVYAGYKESVQESHRYLVSKYDGQLSLAAGK